MNNLDIVFMGTPDFAVPALAALIRSNHNVKAVFTQPPRPKGRGHKVSCSPVHILANEHSIKVHTPKSLRKDEQARADLLSYEPDVVVVAAYGLMLPPEILEAPAFGCLNIHASLLPRWRGAAPIQYSIWKGDTKTGISIMKMEEGLDSGPVIDQKSIEIRPQTTASSLHDEMAALGAAMIVDTLDDIAQNQMPEFTEQDESLVTYAPVLTKDDGRVDWTNKAEEIDRKIKALNPWPGVWTITADDKRLKILEAEAVNESFPHMPGTITDRSGHVVCGDDTAIRLIKVQPENAKVMDFFSALNGNYIVVDSVLD
jgi:methionyl-tRNA formyltransferase